MASSGAQQAESEGMETPGPSSILSTLSTALSSYLPGATSSILPQYILRGHSILRTTLQEKGSSLEEVTTHLLEDIAARLNQSSLSPHYCRFVTGGATPAALTADILTSIYDQNVSVHLPYETISTTVEAAALNMLLDLFYLPRHAWGIGSQPDGYGAGSGTFTTGATASNVLGISVGREWVLNTRAAKFGRTGMSVAEDGIGEAMLAAGVTKVQVLSTMPHSSTVKAASIVGIGRQNVVSISRPSPNKDFLAIDFAKLQLELARPSTASIVVISAGEVNTGRFATASLSDMAIVGALCDEYDSWVHVDGAFGLFGRGTEGLHLADSITSDGHKFLNVPYDCGFFFTKKKELAEKVCHNGGAAYLTPPMVGKDVEGDGIQSPLNIGIENSRRFRALPVYATLLSYGRKAYEDMLVRQVRLARKVAGWLWESEDFDVLPKEESRQEMLTNIFMIVLFRAKDKSVNKELVKRINGTGKIYVSGTKWEGRPAARIAVSTWRVEVERDAKVIQEVLTSVAC